MLNAKKRLVPLMILQLEALLRRMSSFHPKRKVIEDELGVRWAGYRGELTLDYDLRFLPFKSYQILHDIRLMVFGKCFQIDTLVLSPYAAFIVEAKNLGGTLFFDEDSNTFKQVNNGRKKTIDDPLIQVTRQQKQLEEWLRYRGIHGYPIIPMVAICNPSTLVYPPKNHVHPWPIMNSIYAVDRIQEIEELYKDRKPIDMTHIKNKLIAEDIPLELDMINKFSIKPSELELGVHCPQCSKLPMKYVRRRWECSDCGHRSSDAYLAALADYFLLFKSTINNKECRKFLGCSESVSYYLLSKSGLPKIGETKHRRYQKPENIRQLLNVNSRN